MSLRGAAPPAATVVARGPFQAGGVVILDEPEAHHLAVRRVGDGALIRLVDGRGGVATARVTRENEVIVARVIATTSVGAPPVTELLLGPATATASSRRWRRPRSWAPRAWCRW